MEKKKIFTPQNFNLFMILLFFLLYNYYPCFCLLSYKKKIISSIESEAKGKDIQIMKRKK
jgi:hypothetical protein